jgi:hypothetical protein
MTFLSTTLSAQDAFGTAPRRPGILARLLGALAASRQHQAEQEIARYLEISGGKMTDSAEREIERRFFNSSF